jgi:rhodanese-related sulfurtransferase
MSDITSEELKAKLDNGETPIMIDVREPFEYEAYNIGATLIPLSTVPSMLNDYEANKEDEIIMICRSGARSGNATSFLTQMGFKNVRNLVGGMMRWQEVIDKK